MAIMKTVYGSTGSVAYEQVDSILDLGNRTIRIYSLQDGIQERELSNGDRVELIAGPVCIHAEDCPDVNMQVGEGEVTIPGDCK